VFRVCWVSRDEGGVLFLFLGGMGVCPAFLPFSHKPETKIPVTCSGRETSKKGRCSERASTILGRLSEYFCCRFGAGGTIFVDTLNAILDLGFSTS